MQDLPAFPEGPTIFPGYIPSERLVPLSPLGTGCAIISSALVSQARYTESTLTRIHPEFASWLLRKREVDKRMLVSSPLLTKKGELIPFGHILAILNLHVPPFAHRSESVLFYAESNPFNTTIPAVVKYQTDCYERAMKKSEIHPLLKEYFFMKLIYVNSPNLQIVPQPFFVSPQARMGTVCTEKTDFIMDDRTRDFCASSNIRYLVMESGGISLEDIISFCPNYTLPFLDGMNILKQLFVALKQIHSLGIVHGDIHRGNVVRSLRNGERVKIIDFGLAKLLRPGEVFPEVPVRNGTSIRARMHFSPWKYAGYVTSFRDDVYGALSAIAISMGGMRYMRSIDRAEEANNQAFFISRMNGNDLFTIPTTGESIVEEHLGINEESKQVGKILTNLTSIVLSSQSVVNGKPPHDTLIDLVDEILAIIL